MTKKRVPEKKKKMKKRAPGKKSPLPRTEDHTGRRPKKKTKKKKRNRLPAGKERNTGDKGPGGEKDK